MATQPGNNLGQCATVRCVGSTPGNLGRDIEVPSDNNSCTLWRRFPMATRLVFHIKGQRFAFSRDDLTEVVKAAEPARIGKLSVEIEDRMYPVKQPISLL